VRRKWKKLHKGRESEKEVEKIAQRKEENSEKSE